MLTHGAADGDVVEANELGFLDHSSDELLLRDALQGGAERPHPIDGPEKIDRGGTRAGQGFTNAVEIRALLHAEGDTHGGGDADGRGAANHHRADGDGDLHVAGAGDKDLFPGQARLIDHHDARISPFNCFDHELLFSHWLTVTLKSVASRKRFEWKLRDRSLHLGDRTLILGVLNVTPDSFSDGGAFDDPDRAFARAMELEELGADMIDIGAESTRPGSARISEAEELRRLVPVLKRLKGKLTIPISVDTYKAAVAEKAFEFGVEAINDPSGLTFDAELARKVSNANAGMILNHMRGTPETWSKLPPLKDLIRTVRTELDAAAHRANLAGIDRKRIVADPGLGFGKRREQNSEILAQLGELSRLELPILVGPSRKHFLAKESADATEFATAAAVTAAILNGAHMVRVHDVKAMKAAAEVADEIVRADASNAFDKPESNVSHGSLRRPV